VSLTNTQMQLIIFHPI